MECNRDEAVRAQTIAEKKLAEKDYIGAKKFVSKALSLYPGLEGISQLTTTLDVYISAENKVSGEVDWYGILGVSPSADDEVVKKQYRKLALILHPDKNKSIGAEGAFKLISEAWSLLSDKTKRLAYNQRRSLRVPQHHVSAQSRGRPSVPSRAPPKPTPKEPSTANGFHNVKSQNTKSKVTPTGSQQRNDTFWTLCRRCKMHYEYLKTYLNNTLLCPNCHEPFVASETSPPTNFPKSSNLSSGQKHSSSFNHVTGTSQFAPGRNAAPHVYSFDHAHVHNKGPFSRAAVVDSMFSSPNTAAKAANVVKQANATVKRDREEVDTAVKSHVSSSVLQDKTLLKKKKSSDYVGNVASQNFPGNGRPGIIKKPNSTRELSMHELRNMLMKKALKEINEKLNEWSSKNMAAKSADKGKDSGANNVQLESSGIKKDLAKISSNPAAADTEKKEPAPIVIDVPDPDFHDFDKDRAESCFQENQVWAAYDDDDGMPRFYALIHKVISLKPFKIRISWLNSKSTSEFGSLEWRSSGFAKTCGELWIGKHELYKSLNSFSHQVKWIKGNRGAICVYPKKGDVWALFRNWSPDWNEHTPDDVIHKYDMVEVLDDYNTEEPGISVIPLVKVAGFRTVFQSHTDPEKVKRIEKEEMYRFSHQVPIYVLTGQEAQNAPKGCKELDPAATPLELLQVTAETKEEAKVENGEKIDKLEKKKNDTK